MKMKQEHFDEIKRLIEEHIESEGGTEAMVKCYETGDFERPLAVNDLQTRFCWDMFYRGVTSRTSVHGLYTYLDDSHILTALKRICPKVTSVTESVTMTEKHQQRRLHKWKESTSTR